MGDIPKEGGNVVGEMIGSECVSLLMTDVDNHTIRIEDRATILSFVQRHGHLLKGRVLDFGCGREGTCLKPEPYREIVEMAGGEYMGVDKGERIPDGYFDSILCTQVMQYVDDPQGTINLFGALLRKRETFQGHGQGGYLVMTYATGWDEVEREDMWRFTKSGMGRLLQRAGFGQVVHERRLEVRFGEGERPFQLPIGYGVVARV